MDKVAVYDPAEWAGTLPLFHIYPYILCGSNNLLCFNCSTVLFKAQNHDLITIVLLEKMPQGL